MSRKVKNPTKIVDVNKCWWNRPIVYTLAILPMAWSLIFGLIPSLATVFVSFTDMSPTGQTFNWVGWFNYDEFIFKQNTREFWAAVKNTIEFAFFSCLGQNVFAMLLALLLNNKALKPRNFVRALVYLPGILGIIVICYTWVMMMGYKGPVLELFQSIGLAKRGLLNNHTWAWPSIIFISIWSGLGGEMVLNLAGLQSIPNELYEAASIDGAGPAARFWKITLPLLWNVVSINLLMGITSALGVCSIILYTTSGYHDTQTLGFRIYQSAFGIGGSAGLDAQSMGKGAAQSMVMFVLTTTFALGTRWLTDKLDVTK